jgi:hypothetical protein
MHRLPVGEHHHTKPSPAGFSNTPPTTDTAIGLYSFVLWMRDYSGNPRISYVCAIAAPSNDAEIFGGLHV